MVHHCDQIVRSLLKWEYHATLLQVGLCLIESSGGSSMRLLPIHRLLSILLLEVSISGLSAQTTTSGGLAGVVTDPSNAVVPNAKVEIKDDAKGTTQSTKTDQQGMYRYPWPRPIAFPRSYSNRGPHSCGKIGSCRTSDRWMATLAVRA